MRSAAIDWTLYAITDETLSAPLSLEEAVRQAIAGGAGIVQLRDKQASSRALYEKALALRALTAREGVLFIVNDRADVAQAVNADGTHIGQDDLPAHAVRKLVGERMIVGVSVSSLEEARIAATDGADYLGVGPIFYTTTKEITGTTGIGLITGIKQEIDLPFVALGGIQLTNVGQVAQAGADGAAVISALMGAQDIQQAAQALVAAFKEAKD